MLETLVVFVFLSEVGIGLKLLEICIIINAKISFIFFN